MQNVIIHVLSTLWILWRWKLSCIYSTGSVTSIKS